MFKCRKKEHFHVHVRIETVAYPWLSFQAIPYIMVLLYHDVVMVMSYNLVDVEKKTKSFQSINETDKFINFHT